MTTPLTADDETLIQVRLAHIEETDPDTIVSVLQQCRADADARDYFIYFIRRAGSVA